MRNVQENIAMANATGEPDIQTLQEWVEQGYCESIDGCPIELDGYCQHGYPSWLIYLNLI